VRALARWLPAYVDVRDVHDVEAITSRNAAAEVAPADIGLARADVDAIWAAAVRLYRTGLHPALAIAVRHRGQVVIDRALGHLRGNGPDDPRGAPKVPARHDSLFTLFSASKAVTAMLVHLYDERGLLRLDDPIAAYVPEFGRRGKERATIRHVLTHRAGIPTVRDFPADLDRLADWDYVLDRLCDAPALTPPGQRLAYHAISGGFILGEVLQRVTGKGLRALLHDDIAAPLGMETFGYGLDDDRLPDLARHAFTGLPPMPPLTWMVKRALGVGMLEAVDLTNDPRFYRCVIPSGNIVATADEGCRFFELLLRGGTLDGVRIYDPRTIGRATVHHGTLEIDSFLGIPVRYGMGFMLGNPGPGLYGWNAPKAFGHAGFTTVLAWADPERDLSACLMTSGKPFVTPGQVRFAELIYTIARHIPRAKRRR
jgi:CubicO group peptidase (beta-lactamase class C family)